MFRLSRRLAFYCSCRFSQQGSVKLVPYCTHQCSCVVAGVFFFFFFFSHHKSGPSGNRLNASCCLPSSFCGCHQCNQGTGGYRRLIGWEGGGEGIYSREGWRVYFTLKLRGTVPSSKVATAVIGGNSLSPASQSHFQSGHA